MGSEPIVFYVKCRPQGADAWPIAEQYRIVFLGYPPWKPDGASQLSPDERSGYSRALFDISEDDSCARRIQENRGYRRAVTSNANLVKSVTAGSYAIVPRPVYGLCHIGKIIGSFELVDPPEWGECYLQVRKRQKRDVGRVRYHLGDVVQVWHVEAWKSVPFLSVPRWISYRLLSRNTAGVIYGDPGLGLHPFGRIENILTTNPIPPSNVADSKEVERNLMEWVSPTIFEQLVVELLQVEAGPDTRWHHVGGSGDGGVDGLAISPDGRMVGALQCKWYWGGNFQVLFDQLQKNVRERWPDCQLVVAVLSGSGAEPSGVPSNCRLVGRAEIASMIMRYRDRIPLAMTLGVADSDLRR